MAKKTSRKLSANQQEYLKQVKRIKQFISRAEKRGFIFNENVIPEQPKRVTKKRIQELKEITPNVLYSLSEYVDTSTGEIITGKEGRTRERKASAYKASVTRRRNKEAERRFWTGETDSQSTNQQHKGVKYYPDGGEIIYHNILEDFITRLSEETPEYTPYGKKRQYHVYEESERGRKTLYTITMSVKNEIGESALGWRIQENSEEVQDLLICVFYGSSSELISTSVNRLARIIKGSELTMSELMDIGYEQEQNESWESPE